MTQFYEIRIEGHLDGQWVDWFDGMSITLEEDGTTLLSGPVPDQPALYGLLRRVRDLGLPLVAVNRVTDTLNPQNKNNKRSNAKMNPNTTKKLDTKALLSTLWIVVMINMLKADILSLYIPGSAEELAKTSASTGAPIPQLMLGGAITGELAIVMVILSRVLKYGINRWVNIVVGLVTIAYIWGGAASYPHYIFIATVETICLLLIIWNAWKWRNVEA
jgi:hypothetical protein